MAKFVAVPPGVVAAGPIGGARAVLCPGVVVTSVHASANTGQSNWNDVVVEMKVDPQAIGAVDDLMDGLRQLVNGSHPVQQGFSAMTSAVTTNSPWIAQVELDEIEEEMERDPEDIEDPVTLLTLRDLINERMDGIDSALRLAIGE